MRLRTRIAVTFLLLLAAVLAAALGAVSAANRDNVAQQVDRQLDVGRSVFRLVLEANRDQLKQAAQAVALDFGFREAVAGRDTDTLVSALDNVNDRVGAAMAVLTSLDGTVIAAAGSQARPGSGFPAWGRLTSGLRAAGAFDVAVEGGRVYQLVAVPVRSPLPVAWIVMGFRLDDRMAAQLASVTRLGVQLSVAGAGGWSVAAQAMPAGQNRQDERAVTRIHLSDDPAATVVATLSRSVAEARAPFDRLTETFYWIAALSLLGSACAAFWLARNITRPLQSLIDAVGRIRGGKYDVDLQVVRRDELGVLAEGIQVMQGAVRSRDRDIRRLAYEDGLTGLMNATAFDAALGSALAGLAPVGGDATCSPATADGAAIGVAVINLHRFRRINEHLGHAVGDRVLVEIARRLTALPLLETSFARLSGDHFAAFIRLADAAALQAWGARLCNRLAEPVQVEEQPIDVNATVGLALAPKDAAAPNALLSCADLALEYARRAKRPMGLYDTALKPSAPDQLWLLGDLQRAVDQNELRLYFQPKLELATGRVSGAEVLLRWQHPTRGFLGPAAFIPFAEQTGFIRRLTRWTLDQAVARGAAWHAAGKPLALAVNVSAEDVADLRFDQRVAWSLNKHRLPPALLTLEVTESGFIEDPARALHMLGALASLGVKLSIDDFGTGYSSLSHLARMPVDELKIDRSFVQGLESEGEFAAVVRSAIDMGHSLGLQVVAEGIETESAAAQLRSFGCDVAQGYLYAKPMPLADFEAWLCGKTLVPVSAESRHFEVAELTDTVLLAAR
jgi:diguanylate cyclase (GGDEF)-like protein